MKLLKVEPHNYHIIYVNDDDKYDMYKRLDENTWEIFKNDKWKPVHDYFELEKVFNEQK